MDDQTAFTDLFERKIPFVRMIVDIQSTNATRPPILAVWKLDHDGFVQVARHIVDVGNAQYLGDVCLGRQSSIESVAVACNDVGPGERFFRLDAEFGRWLDETDPETILEVHSIII